MDDDEIFWVDGDGTISVPAAAKEASEKQSGELRIFMRFNMTENMNR